VVGGRGIQALFWALVSGDSTSPPPRWALRQFVAVVEA
jgi:hypothetical protein